MHDLDALRGVPQKVKEGCRILDILAPYQPVCGTI